MRKFYYTSLVIGLIFGLSSCSKDSAVPEQEKPAGTPIGQHTYGNLNDLMDVSTGPTHSDKTPMGIHFENLKTAGAAELNWLKDPEKEPGVPPNQVAYLNYKSFPVDLYPFGAPSPADCNQRNLGDCSAIAIYAALAYINPDFLRGLITDHQDDTYTVNMFDPQGKPIQVGVSNHFLSTSSGNLAGVNGKQGQATWATILEKALMKYNEVYALVANVEGIGSEYVSPTLTGNGNSFAFYSRNLSPEDLQRAVQVSLGDGKIVIGGFDTPDLQVGDSNTITGHAWSFSFTSGQPVHNYIPGFVMRNPWGIDNGTDLDGQMYVPLIDAITQCIDLRIIEAGKALPDTIPGIYTPPVY